MRTPSSSPPTPGAAVDASLASAVVARFLKETLAPRGDGRRRRVPEAGELDALRRAAVLLGGPESELAAAADDVARQARGAPEPDAYDRLFGHSLRGRVCPYETEYGPREAIRQAHELADLAGFYRAFGLEPRERAERCDHVAVELEFVELLSLKEAYALETGDESMRTVTTDALGRFLGEHLGRFGRAFGLRLAEEDDGVYGAAGRLLAAWLGTECARRGRSVGPEMLELSLVVDDPAPMACGAEEGGEAESFEV